MNYTFGFRQSLTALTLCCSLLAVPAASAAEVTIYRDEWGVPHVYGPTDESVVFGYVFAQAQDNFWQIEDSMIQALGRYAEVMGEAAVGADYLNRALRVVELAKTEWAGLSDEARAITEAAAAGLNTYLAESGTQPRLIERFEPWHFLAFSRFSQYQLFIFNRSGISPEEIAAHAQGALTTASFDQGSLAPIARHAVADAQAQAGSNTWAIAPARSKSGNTLLFINPHQPYFGPGQWHEGHLYSEAGLHFSGAGFFGSPFPTIGHNDRLGWSHTVNRPDVIDVYALTLEQSDAGLSYRYGEETRAVKEWTDTVKVRQPDGVEERTFRFQRTHHGPIVAERDGASLAVRMAKFVEGGQLEQRLAMLKSRNLEQFKSALGRLATPMFNTMYADTDGNIFYAYYGAVPRRDPQFDWSQPVDGHDPATEWQGYHPLAELPVLENPPTGYLQNCNATPFLATGGSANLDPANYPSYMAPEEDNNRSRMSRILLGGKDKLSFKAFTRMTWDTRVLEADTMLPLLRVELEARDLPPARSALTNDALQHLQRWDRVSGVDSTQMTLYFFWRHAMRSLDKSDPVEAFEYALDYMQNTYGSWRVAWGEVNRLQRQHSSGTAGFDDDAPSLPVAGGPGNPFGTIFNVYARPEPGKKKMYAVAGHSYVSVVEFGHSPRARSVMPFGSSADPDSPHYFDQAELFAGQRFKRAWFKLDDVRSNAQSAVKLQYP